MAINERLIDTKVEAAGNGGAGTGNQEEGLILHLDANDVDSYDGDGSVWYDIKDHEYTPETNVDEHFNTVTYTGSASPHIVDTVGFQPDLIWIKNRDTTDSHAIVDSVRGISSSTGYLASNETTQEQFSTNMPTSVQPEGFTITGNGGRTNAIGEDYVAWCFKAGGAPTATNTGGQTPTSGSKMVDGTAVTDNYPTANIYPTKQSVNTKLGFSVTEYTGAGSNNSLPHGLDVPPQMYIIKRTSIAQDWWVYTTEGGDFQYLRLNETSAGIDADQYYARPTGSIISQGNSGTNIMYAFASKRGVSKVGSYEGTGAAGNKVYTGFEPAFVMVKSLSTGSWIILDNKRNISDPRAKILQADLSAAEIDLKSTFNLDCMFFHKDGFSLQDSNSTRNAINTKYIYYAVAKNTNETSLIPDTDLELHLDAASFPEKNEIGYNPTPSTWTDSSGNGYNGTISGATFDSELGNWLDFDGVSDKVDFTGRPITATSSVTIETWVKFEAGGGNYPYVAMIGQGNNIAGSTLSIARFYQTNNFYSYVGNQTVDTGISLSNDTWYHLVVTQSGTSLKQYINGELVKTSTITANNFADNFRLGYFYDTAQQQEANYLSGKIGQTRIYSSALTQDQVRQNYNFTKNNYPNGINASLTNVSWAANYFEIDSSSDAIEFGNGLKPYLDGLTTALSASYWIRFDDLNATQNLFAYYNSSLGGDSAGFSQSMVESGKLQWYVSPTSGTTNGRTTSVCVTANTWHHVVMVLDMSKSQTNGTGGRVQIFVDETEQSITYTESTGSTTLRTGSASLKPSFGFTTNSSGTKENHFDGRVSKIKIFDKALTQEEITTLHSEGE